MSADDGIGRRGPAERLRIGVEVVADGLVEIDDGAEDAAIQAPLGRREMHVEARMECQPALWGLGLVGGLIVEGQV